VRFLEKFIRGDGYKIMGSEGKEATQPAPWWFLFVRLFLRKKVILPDVYYSKKFVESYSFRGKHYTRTIENMHTFLWGKDISKECEYCGIELESFKFHAEQCMGERGKVWKELWEDSK
jgi:hypothetical protein